MISEDKENEKRGMMKKKGKKRQRGIKDGEEK
jgi:hypothetical protein